MWGDKTSAYIHEKVWGVSNLDCLHTMDWMSGEGHTGVVRCLQVDDHDQPRDVDVNHDDVDVGDDPFLALKRFEVIHTRYFIYNLRLSSFDLFFTDRRQ